MSHPHGPWTIHRTERPYADDFLTVAVDHVTRPDGERGTYATVEVKPGVGVLPIDGEGRVYLVRQFRYALGAESLEVVEGGLEAGEAPEAGARRELHEELGIEAREWTALPLVQLDTALVRCPMHLFVARGLTFTQPEPEESEDIRAKRLPLDEALAKVERGEIVDAASILLLLSAARAARPA